MDAPPAPAAPDLEAAIATAYDWHQDGGGLYAFASNGGMVTDPAVLATALQQVEQSLAWLTSRASEIDAGALPEFKADVELAQKKGLRPTEYLTQRLDNLKAALEQAQGGAGEPQAEPAPAPLPSPEPAPLPPAPTASPVVSSKQAAGAPTTPTSGPKANVATFNQARAVTQKLLQKVEGGDPELIKQLNQVLFELDEIETEAGGNLTKVLAGKEDPETAEHAVTVIKALVALQKQVNGTPKVQDPGPTATPEQQQQAVEASFHRVQAFLAEAKLTTDATRCKIASNGCIHVAGLKSGPATLGALVQFATSRKIALKLVKAFEEADEEATCPECSGPGVPLGTQGSKKHYRCRDCGVGFNHEDDKAPKFAADKEAENSIPDRERPEDLPYDEGAVAAFTPPVVPDTLALTAAAEPDNHVIKLGEQYLVLGEDPADLEQGGVKPSLSPNQKDATRMNHSVAQLWMDDDRLGNFIAAEGGEGQEARIVRVVPKKTASGGSLYDGGCPICGSPDCHGECADNQDHQEETTRAQEHKQASTAKVALPLPPPTANGNHAGPANPINPTGAPAPGTPAPMVAPAIPSSQGPAVTHTNPGTPAAPALPAAPAGAPAPQLDANGQPVQASTKTACDGSDCKGDCPNCKKKKEAAAKTADTEEQAAMAREVVMSWMSSHPRQQPNFQDPDWKLLWEQNKAECPDENLFIAACQKAFSGMSQGMTRQASRIVAQLALMARGLRGPGADQGDSVANAVKFIKGNRKELEAGTVPELRQTLADAGYSRPVVELAIEEVYGEDATLANGALVKDLITDKA
jgi:hypothetical protein